MTTSDASLTALVAEVKAALRARKIPGATGHLALKWLGALVQAVEDQQAQVRLAEFNARTIAEERDRATREVAQLRADGQRLRNQAQAVVKAGWALSDVGPFLPDTANGRAFGEVLDALEICLRETAGNAP